MLLRPATDAEKRARDDAAYPPWGPPLDLTAWRAREERLRAHRWSRDAMTTWLWCGEDRAILSSCETFRMACTVEGRAGNAYGIASVFTEPALRAKGHATKMLQALSPRLREQDREARAAFLFSDVGARIYERAGYHARPAVDWVVKAAPAPGRLMTAWVKDTELERLHGRIAAPKDPVVIWPSAVQLDWHLERERIYAEALGRPRPECCGATIGESTAIWAGVLRSKELVVLLIDARDDDALSALLRCAADVAHRAGLEQVVLWDQPGLPKPPSFARKHKRGGSLPMIAPLATGVSEEGWRTIPRALWI